MAAHISAAEEYRLIRMARGYVPFTVEVTPHPSESSHKDNASIYQDTSWYQVDPVREKKTYERNRKKALEKLLEAHSAFIMSVVRGYYIPPNGSIELADVMSVAKMGFIEAVDRYDLESGYRINTFCIYRVKKAIEDFLTQMAYASKIPYPEVVKTRKLLDFADLNLEEATIDELAAIFKVADIQVDFQSADIEDLRKKAINAIHGVKTVNIASLIKGTASAMRHSPGEESTSSEESLRVHHLEAQMATEDVAVDVMSDLTVEEIRQAIESLPVIEALPIMCVLGIDMPDGTPLRLRRAADIIGAPYNLIEHCYKNAIDQVRKQLRSLKES